MSSKNYKIFIVTSGGNASGQLGAAAGQRTVFLEGSANFNSYLVQVREFEAQLHNYFLHNGWGLQSIQLVPTSSSALNTLTPVKIKIETVVSPEYSDAYVVAAAMELLMNYKTSFGAYLTNVALSVSNSTKGKPPVKDKDIDGDLLNNEFLKKFAETLGISVPIATVGGALVLLWYLKR